MEQPDGLDDPAYAAFAWGRFRRILWGMAFVAVLAAGLAEYWLWSQMGELHIVTAIATFLGVFFTIMMAAALMGLMFLSSGSGHDAQVEDPLKGEVDLD
jgi:O-antigen ligase